MKTSRSVLQKISTGSGMASFVIAAVCGVFLYIKVGEMGYQNPVTASLLASVFFFIFVGFLLVFIGRCDIPSFKFDDKQNN